MRDIKKAIYTLCVDGYDEAITNLTFPLINAYAKKIQADFFIISERKYPDYPAVYEKLQIYNLGKDNDWNIYIDADALIHPDLMDLTSLLHKNTVAHHGSDFASQRWVYDRYFLRDGRHIGSGNWFTIASDWCIDLWHPLDDLSLEQAVRNIHPTVQERMSGVIDPSHLLDDYVLSRNIAKYGLKFRTIRGLLQEINPSGEFQDLFWHQYLIPREAKVLEMQKTLKRWRLL